MENRYLSTLTNDSYFNWWDINHNSRECSSMPLLVNVAARVNAAESSTNYNKQGRLDYYLIYILSGSLTVKTRHGGADAFENDLFIIPPKSSYEIKTKDLPLRYLCVHFTGSDVIKILNEYEISLFPQINRLSYKNHMLLRFNTLFDGFAKNDSLRDKELALLLERLFIEASRGIKNATSEKVLLAKSIRFINENYPTKISIPYLAKLENMCVTSYNILFKEQVGMAPTKYLIKLRIEHARELLESTNLPIEEIGLSCGYPDINFFSRVFKKYVGVSPSNYRKQIIPLKN